MDYKHIKRSRFKRGPDRRLGSSHSHSDKRVDEGDRRKLGPSWLSLFRGMDDETISESIGDFEVLTLPAGSLLLKPGDKNECVYLLLSGQLVANLDSSLNPDAAMPIRPGECIGEFSAIDGKPVSAFVIALQDARVLQVSPESFWQRLMPIPGVARNLLVSLTERMRRSNEATLDSQRKQLALQYIKKELEVAKQLQAGMLPLHRPLFPERCDIEVAGIMEPASEIGGDLFDAFFVDEHLLFFSIGDVSGHGIPAALFMARTIGLMRISALSTTRPDHLLERINNQLCEGNDANMFVTLFCGFLDVRSGELTYSNAGHHAPLLVRLSDGRRLPIPKGALVGVISGIKYSAQQVILERGDALICFTDGVTEANSEDGTEFSEDRLLALSANHADRSLEELLDIVRREVASFTNHQPLADDCTMLAMRRRLPG
ncbi:MAG: cyclic nucleotide-binding protein [Proteobacteria bacterium ST_bin11]|nr:MAG: cyclic nucleotide-binding protein [Proteobacteria bacterium ST_bin11]